MYRVVPKVFPALLVCEMAIFVLTEVSLFSCLPHILENIEKMKLYNCHKRQAFVSSNYGGFILKNFFWSLCCSNYVQVAVLAIHYIHST